jgi:hypothetical protein
MSFDRRSVGRFVFQCLVVLVRMWPHLLVMAALLVVAFFWVVIDPVREYGFGGGVLHGFFGMQNLILFCFTDHELWAPSNTGRGYTAGFYVGLFLIPAVIRTTIEIVVFILKRR